MNPAHRIVFNEFEELAQLAQFGTHFRDFVQGDVSWIK